MYIDNRFQHKMHLNINMYDKWEGQIVYVSGGGLPKTITIGNIYRPPRMLVADINQFIDELTLVIQSIKCKSINLAGDYNLNLLKINENAACSNYFDMMTSHSLFPQITFPTRLSHTSATLINNIFCKFDETTKEIKSGILLNNLSDHLPYFILLDIIAFKTPTLKSIKIYPQHNLALRNIISDIHASDLHTDIDHNPTSDPNVTYKKILDVLEKAKHKHMSGKLVKYNKYKHKKSTWLTNGLLKSIRFRDKLYKQMKCILPTSVEYEIIRLNLKTYNNILRKSLFRAKRLFLSYTFNKYNSDIKNTWKSINELLSRNYTNKSFPQSLVIDGTQISDKREIVNTFNSFFTNIGVDLANKIAYSGNKTFRDYLTDNESDNLSFTNVDEHTVINIINSLPTKHSSGYDTISTKLLKEIALTISKPLTILTN